MIKESLNLLTSKPRLFICGDSFCFSDPEYGPNWADMLKDSLPHVEVINISSPGASNYLISLQVQHALKNHGRWIIYLATSSIRQEFSISRNKTIVKDRIERYWDPRSQKNKDVVSNSWINATNYTENLLTAGNQTIKQFFTDFIDTTSMVNKNFIFIDYTLKLLESSLPRNNWAWSSGGFEHKGFSDSIEWDFSKYQDRMCPINLWDYNDRSIPRPYYHVVDPEIQSNVCDRYLSMLGFQNN